MQDVILILGKLFNMVEFYDSIKLQDFNVEEEDIQAPKQQELLADYMQKELLQKMVKLKL